MTDARWKAGLVRYVPEDVARYRDHGVWGELTISEEFHRSALRFPDDLAVITPENRLTYRELDELSDRLALGLLDLGLTPGDRVLFQVTNRWETVAAWYGVLKAGLIPVATLAAHRAHEISDTARRSGAVAHLVEAGTANFDLVSFAQEQAAATPALRFLLTISAGSDAPGRRIEDLWAAGDAGAARSAVEAVQEAILPDDVAVFQLSGGTTGVPKIIPRLQAEYWYNARRYAEALRFGPTTKNSHAGPVIHNAGIVCAVHGPHSVGGATVLPGPDVRARIPFLVEEGITDILIGRVNFVLVEQPLPHAEQLSAGDAQLLQVRECRSRHLPAREDDATQVFQNGLERVLRAPSRTSTPPLERGAPPSAARSLSWTREDPRAGHRDRGGRRSNR